MVEYRLMVSKDKVAEWINNQFFEWEKKTGERQTLTAFAEFVGVSRVLMSRWMTKDDSILPGNDKVILLANLFGPEIYDLLEWPRPKYYESNRK